MSKKTKQEAEFTRLWEETAVVVTEFQEKLRDKIKAATNLEVTVLATQIQEDFLSSISVATRALLLSSESEADPQRVVATIADNYSETFFTPLSLTKEDFLTRYTAHHSLPRHPTAYALTMIAPPAARAALGTQETDATDDEPTDSLFLPQVQEAARARGTAPAPRQPAVQPGPHNHAIQQVKRSLESLFVTAWNVYLSHHRRNATDLALKKLATEHFDTKSTEETAMEIDTEPPANRELLMDLVQKEVEKRTAKLQTEVQRLRSKVSDPKNNPRGSGTSALTKKQVASKTNQGTRQTNGGKTKTADVPNATSAANRKKNRSRSPSRRQSRPKATGSSNKQKQSRQRTGSRS